MNSTRCFGSYAFPIVACIFMFKYTIKNAENNRKDILDITNKHHEEMTELKEEITQALNNNTIALTKLCETMKGSEHNEIK